MAVTGGHWESTAGVLRPGPGEGWSPAGSLDKGIKALSLSGCPADECPHKDLALPSPQPPRTPVSLKEIGTCHMSLSVPQLHLSGQGVSQAEGLSQVPSEPMTGRGLGWSHELLQPPPTVFL